MTASVSRQADLRARAEGLFPGGVNSPVRAFRSVGRPPLVLDAGSGARVRDADGRWYVDWIGSWGPALLGHARAEVVEAVRAAALDGFALGATSPREVELGELVRAAMPSMERLRFTSSGTEAAMSAVRLARGATGRDLVIKFAGGYHGHSDGLLVEAGSGVATLAIPGSAGVPAATASATIVVPYNDAAAVEAAFAAHPDRIAAIIVEPVAANAGVIPPRRRLPRPASRADGRERRAAHLRRGHHRLPGRPRRRPGPLRRDARPDRPRQDRRRRDAGRGLRRPARPDGAGGPDRAGLPGRHALRPSAGDGRRARRRSGS